MLLDLRDRLLQRLADPSVQRRRRRASVNLRHQHRREKRVDVRAQLSLDLRALAIGDCQAVGWTRLDPLQDKCECALHLRLRTACRPAGAQGPRPPCWRRRCRSIPAALPAARRTPRLRPGPTRRRRPARTPATGPLCRPQSTPAPAPAQFSVRAWCAGSAPSTTEPATTATDMTTASSLIRSPFADSSASVWTMPSRQWLSPGTRGRAGANSSPGVTR